MPKIKFTYLLVLFLSFTSLNYAQFYFFGRNKVQYEKFEWKVLKTEHFDIYYYDDFEELAEIGAKIAETAFDELKVKFNHIVLTKIPLIFYNTHIHFQQTNVLPSFIPEGVGGFFEFIKGRVVIPYTGSIEQFEHVVKHELVHVFMTSKIFNILSDHRIPADRYPPLWFVEGLAEYWSYHWDTQAEMVMRDAVLNNIFVPLENIYAIYGSYLLYKEGQNLLSFISKEYGEEKIVQIMENFWRFSSFDDLLEFTLGEDVKIIDEKWLYDLKQEYYPLYENKFPHYIESKKITDFGFNFSPNYFQSDSTDYIYFIGNRSGYSSVYRLLYSPKSKEIIEPEVIIQGEREAVFESFHLLQSSISVSPEGLIAFVTKSGGSDVIHLYSIADDEIINNFRYDDLISIRAPKFSSSGRKIVFNATDRKGFSDLFVMDMDTDNITRLTND